MCRRPTRRAGSFGAERGRAFVPEERTGVECNVARIVVRATYYVMPMLMLMTRRALPWNHR